MYPASPDLGDLPSRIRRRYDSARLEDSFLNLRIIIIDEQFYKGLRDKLYAAFQTGASTILYNMGLGYGELIGTNMKNRKLSRFETIKKFMALGKDNGYGKFHTPLLKMILSGVRGEPIVRIEDCFFAGAVGTTGKVECYIMAGIIAGAAPSLMNKKYNCLEEKCICKGDPYCEFKLQEDA